jgi:hypothetical protein
MKMDDETRRIDEAVKLLFASGRNRQHSLPGEDGHGGPGVPVATWPSPQTDGGPAILPALRVENESAVLGNDSFE